MDDKEKPNFERREPGYWHGNLLRNHRDADVYWVEALVELFRA